MPVLPDVQLGMHIRGAGEKDPPAQVQVRAALSRYLLTHSRIGGAAHRRAATLEDRMHHLETLIQAIPPAVFAAGGVLSNADANGNGLGPTPLDPAGPHASFASSTHTFPTGVPPPSLSSYPLMNPSTFFGPSRPASSSRHASPSSGAPLNGHSHAADRLAEETARMALSPSYLYLDDEGYTRWQGETSGMPLLDLLVERHRVGTKQESDQPVSQHGWAVTNAQNAQAAQAAMNDWFPDRQPRRTESNPEAVWKLITSFIAPDLMDRYVCVCWGDRRVTDARCLFA